MRMPESRLLTLYYAATAAFLLLDFAFGVNVRVAALEDLPGLRIGYYGLLFACLGLVVWRPAWSATVGALESLTTLVMLILATGVRTLVPADVLLESGDRAVTIAEVVNFMISGSIAYFSWQRSMLRLFGPEP